MNATYSASSQRMAAIAPTPTTSTNASNLGTDDDVEPEQPTALHDRSLINAPAGRVGPTLGGFLDSKLSAGRLDRHGECLARDPVLMLEEV
jgi:hypothetical protein